MAEHFKIEYRVGWRRIVETFQDIAYLLQACYLRYPEDL